MNKIDGKNDDGESDHEDEKPPGEESQAEFVVTALTPDEKPADKVQTPVKNSNEAEADVKKVAPESESTIEKPQSTEDLPLTATVNNTSSTKETATPEPAEVSEPADVSEDNSQASVTSLDESKESEELEPSPTPAPRRKAARGRKRPAAGTRKKTTTPRSTRSKKAVEDIVGSEDGVGNDVETDGLTGSQEEIKKAKVDDEMSKDSIGADESNANMQEEVATEEVDAKPKRVTRARARKK